MVRAAITSLTSAAHASLQNASIAVLLPTLIQNPHFPSQTTVDWTDAEVATTVSGALQPAGAEAVMQAGLEAAREWQQLYCEPVGLAVDGRVRIDDTTYRVVRVREYASHTSALLERVETAEMEEEGEEEGGEEGEP